jgi:hypothetical protein
MHGAACAFVYLDLYFEYASSASRATYSLYFPIIAYSVCSPMKSDARDGHGQSVTGV